ncbi:MAG: hypothetical protein FJW14_17165 [Acidimicrobiia bacterium]|nr:hypothetical protein [Acidimicrobiia bacterium]
MKLPTAAAPLFAAVLATAQCTRPAEAPGGAGAAGAEPQFKTVATNDQVMDAIIIPNAQSIWDAVVYVDGKLVTAPKTDDDWYNLQMNAYAVAEAGNLLKIGARVKDNEDWVTFSTALTDRSMEAVRAAEKKDLQALLEAGGNVYNVCTDCHRKYVQADPNAADPPVPTVPGSN